MFGVDYGLRRRNLLLFPLVENSLKSKFTGMVYGLLCMADVFFSIEKAVLSGKLTRKKICVSPLKNA